MSELTLPTTVKFTEYKGFTLNTKALDNEFNEFVGVAVGKAADDPKNIVKFMSTGTNRNAVGQQLKAFIDTFRKYEKQPKLIIT